jgi:hypothetical protein
MHIDPVLLLIIYIHVFWTHYSCSLFTVYLFLVHCWKGPIIKHFTVSLYLSFMKHLTNNIWFDLIPLYYYTSLCSAPHEWEQEFFPKAWPDQVKLLPLHITPTQTFPWSSHMVRKCSCPTPEIWCVAIGSSICQHIICQPANGTGPKHSTPLSARSSQIIFQWMKHSPESCYTGSNRHSTQNRIGLLVQIF